MLRYILLIYVVDISCLLRMLLCIVVCRYVYSLEYGRTLNTSLAHDDAVSQLCLHKDLLVSSSCDSTVKVKMLTTGIHCVQSQLIKLIVALVCCYCFCKIGKHLFLLQ